jgi:hypothetical protein
LKAWLTSKRYRERILAYTDPEGARRLQALAGKWRCTKAAAVRRLIDEAAQREGIE